MESKQTGSSEEAWEEIPEDGRGRLMEHESARMKVPGGWLVRFAFYCGGGSTLGQSAAATMQFVSDPGHTWKLPSESESSPSPETPSVRC